MMYAFAFLRSPSKDLYWFQLMLLDVGLFLFGLTSLTLFIVYKLIKCVIWIICCRKKKVDKLKQS